MSDLQNKELIINGDFEQGKSGWQAINLSLKASTPEAVFEIVNKPQFEHIIDKNDKPVKIMAQYHQYFGVNKAFNAVLKAIKPGGDGKAGIVWHTQGSGKSYSMVMLAHKLLQEKTLNVPTIVPLTDRIDLDDQLYKTFFSAKNFSPK